MGKTSYARFLSAVLAQKCLEHYESRIPILLSLGDFTTAPDLESLIFTQLTNFTGSKISQPLHFGC
jgi:SAM-dependent MidA family methyltransferase